MSVWSLLAEILFVGHSLVGPDLAPMVEAGLRARGQEDLAVEAQIINGAPLSYQWEKAAEAEGVDGRARLAGGTVDALILAEGVPLASAIQWNDSVAQVAQWADLAWQANPATQVYIYETWHSLKSGSGEAVDHDPGADQPWDARITADLSKWESLAVQADAARPPGAPPLRVIPAGQAMLRAAEAAKAGALPGIGDISDLFSDDIHPNGKGLYLIAVTHIAALTGENPEGLPARLGRSWQSRDARITDEQALALQRIAWAAVQAQEQREAGRQAAAPAAVAPVDTPAAAPVVAVASDPVTPPAPIATVSTVIAPAITGPLTGVTNPNLALGLAGVNDWSVQQPFLDVMKTARPWTGHIGDQWGGMDHDALARDGWLDADGWPNAMPPGISGIATLVLTDLPEDAGAVAGHYILRWQGKGTLRVEGRAENQRPEAGGIGFDYTPGEGAVIVTLTEIDVTDPIRNLSLVRADRMAALDGGAIFNPDWLDRIRGVKLIRFMDWMMTNNATLSQIEDSPKFSDYTWARNGVPVEVMVALANELDADPWFTLPHLGDDALVRFYAESVADLLEPGRKAWVELSNEVWNWQFSQAHWAEEQGKARWGRDSTWVQFYALRAAEVATIWSDVFGDAAPERLVRVIATQTGYTGLEAQILDAPQVLAEGRPAPKTAFDAYAVTGYFAGLLVIDEKLPMVRDWLTESAKADPARPLALATVKAAEELRDGRHSGLVEDTVQDLLTRVLPYQAEVAKKAGLRLVMYEGGSHLVGMGQAVDDADVSAFLQGLSYTPEVASLYAEVMGAWAKLTDTPFNAFVDVYSPGKWGSWGALRHLTDENPRWQVVAKGCVEC
ncbi:hypothetical protein [Gemmobacter serpentinus]|uniref:hypothetical protein n=1 Tax=Gemmobacter serpentinus TaxID=2652247 RepID=UPI00124CAB6D|nr:hypothetical protein [Gemmobacter serpentinus]